MLADLVPPARVRSVAAAASPVRILGTILRLHLAPAAVSIARVVGHLVAIAIAGLIVRPAPTTRAVPLLPALLIGGAHFVPGARACPTRGGVINPPDVSDLAPDFAGYLLRILHGSLADFHFLVDNWLL